jgi:DNA polymerase III alpha subunit
MKTQLADSVLWFDGSLEVDPSKIMSYIQYKDICVSTLTDEIKQYNKLVDTPIAVKHDVNEFDTSWNIPSMYLEIDIHKYIQDKLINDCLSRSDEDFTLRYNRVKYEMSVYSSLNLLNLLRTMVYIIDTYKENNVVWGVGRGSSVSSYILYLLEVHDIDSVMYKLEFSEFLGE